MQNKESIDEFTYFFDKQIKEIGELNNLLFKKISIISLMDALSRVWANKEKQNRKRFTGLITECIGWEHGKRVSITMTYYRLMESRPFSNKPMEDKFTKLFNKLQSSTGRIYRIPEIDPIYDDFGDIIKSKDDRSFLLKSTHAELIYTYRNGLIHEYRQHGGIEFSNDNESPYYHLLTNFDTNKQTWGKKTWELVYPAKFLINLATAALNKIKEKLLKEDIDPYSFFNFGSTWRD